jgi:hypothetical protein
MSLVLQSSGGGSITISEPATASNFTQTLPAATGEIMVSGNMPAFSAYIDPSNQSVTTNTWTKAALNTEEFDTASAFNTTTNRFTPLVAGYYQIQGGVQCQATANTQTVAACSIYKNGTIYKQGSTWSNSATGVNNILCVVSAVIYFNGSTDYVELWGYNAGTSPVFLAGSVQTYFTGCMVRGA